MNYDGNTPIYQQTIEHLEHWITSIQLRKLTLTQSDKEHIIERIMRSANE